MQARYLIFEQIRSIEHIHEYQNLLLNPLLQNVDLNTKFLAKDNTDPCSSVFNFKSTTTNARYMFIRVPFTTS